MNPQPPSIRTLARQLGLSRTTVSDALRGARGVRRATAERVVRAAREAGYQVNPVQSAVMSQMKRGRTRSWFGSIAALDLVGEDRPGSAGAFQREIFQGARERAAELGFAVDGFSLGTQARTLRRMDAIFQARGISGILLLPSWHAPDVAAIDWSRYAGVYTDYGTTTPPLHTVCADHHRALFEVLVRIRTEGWTRPALCVQKHADERLQHRWTAAYYAHEHARAAPGPVPPLLFDTFDPAAFTAWFKKHRPDVVIGPRVEALELMRSAGARVPETHAFIALNILPFGDTCAGLDLQPRHMGARAAEMLIGQLQRNERGLPAEPLCTLVPSRWVDGPTYRPRR